MTNLNQEPELLRRLLRAKDGVDAGFHDPSCNGSKRRRSRRAADLGRVADDFDVVTVGVQHECAVIIRVVVRP